MRRTLDEIISRIELYLSLPAWWSVRDLVGKQRAYMDMQLAAIIWDIENYLGVC